MYGWRARAGLVVPSSNTTVEPEFRGSLPEGVSAHTARMHLEDVEPSQLEHMAGEADRCVALLGTAGVDVVAYACTTGSLVEGPGYDERLEARLAEPAGVPVVATAASVRRAFDALGLNAVAVSTPYTDDLTAREVDFLEAAGYDVVAARGLGIRPNLEIGRLDPGRAYREARAVDHPDADGVFVSCTNYPTFEAIPALEADLGKPVVTSNQATLWDLLCAVDLETTGVVPGSLGGA